MTHTKKTTFLDVLANQDLIQKVKEKYNNFANANLISDDNEENCDKEEDYDEQEMMELENELQMIKEEKKQSQIAR